MILLRAAARHKSVVLLDFLAPSLLSRAASTSRERPKPISLQAAGPSPSELVEKVNRTLPLIHPTHGVSDSQVTLFNQTVMEFGRATTAKDAHTVLQLWQRLEEQKLLHFLQRSQVDAASKLLANSFIFGRLDPSHADLVQDIALQAAVSRSTDALNDLLVLLLKQKDYKAVIELYGRFMELVEDRSVWDDNVDDGRDAEQSTGLVSDDSGSRRVPHIPGRVNILLAVTTAHLLQDTFQHALQTCLKTVVRFHNQSTKTYLNKLGFDPQLETKLHSAIKQLDIARMVARPPSLSKHIMNLAGAPSTKLLETLYQYIITGLSGPNAYLASDPSKITPQQSVAMTETGWTSFLVAFLKCRRRDMASQIWTDMGNLGIHPGVSLWTALIDSYDSIRAVDEAISGWNMMTAQGIKPEALTYRALISTLFHGRKVDEAMKVFQTFQQTPPKDTSPAHTLSVYNTVLNGLLSSGRETDAQTLLKKMETQGPTPDLVSYNTLLAHFGRRGNFKLLANLVSRMGALNLTGDVFSYSTILSALLKAGREDAPELMIGIMRKQGVQPNVATYSAIIDHQIRERSEKNLQAILRMLNMMERDPNVQPNEVTYTSVLAGLYRGEWLEPDKAEEWRKEIVSRMAKRGVEFNVTTYHTLIKACLEYSRPEGLTYALAYYREMRHKRIPLNHTGWYVLLLGLLRRGDWAVADEIVADMYRLGHKPSGAVLDLVGKVRRRGIL